MEPIKFCVAAPMEHLELTEEHSSMLFALSQHYKGDSAYREMCLRMKSKGMFVILDNGMGDFDTSTTDDDLINIVKELKPDFVIPRDILFDKDTTMHNLDVFIDRMIEEDLLAHTGIMGCPQGNTKEEWLECYSYMHAHPYVGMIGLSKIAVPKAFANATDDRDIVTSRVECVKLLKEQNMLDKPLHLLGGAELSEFAYYYLLDENAFNIISHDSCITVLSGALGMKMNDPNYVRPSTPRNYFEMKLNEQQINLAKHNILMLVEALETQAVHFALGHNLYSSVQGTFDKDSFNQFRPLAVEMFIEGTKMTELSTILIQGSDMEEILRIPALQDKEEVELYVRGVRMTLSEFCAAMKEKFPPVGFHESFPHQDEN